jgi:predicted metalloprotease with PDZ domain
VCPEYFHNFNVKRIRPLALGPFNYDMENLTNMLWVSEGLSVYYEDLVLVRAGLMTRQQYLDKMQTAIGAFENSLPGLDELVDGNRRLSKHGTHAPTQSQRVYFGVTRNSSK